MCIGSELLPLSNSAAVTAVVSTPVPEEVEGAEFSGYFLGSRHCHSPTNLPLSSTPHFLLGDHLRVLVLVINFCRQRIKMFFTGLLPRANLLPGHMGKVLVQVCGGQSHSSADLDGLKPPLIQTSLHSP